jgi:hypothetical protein
MAGEMAEICVAIWQHVIALDAASVEQYFQLSLERAIAAS